MANDFRNTSYSRAIRNNNPGNIRIGDNWQGMAGNDGQFVIFSDMAYGIRAWLMNYHSQIAIHGVKTVREYITKYAPPTENNTASYIASIVADTGLTPDSKLPTDQPTVTALFKAQIRVEEGSEASMITDTDITEGFTLFSQSYINFFTQRLKAPQAISQPLFYYLPSPFSRICSNILSKF